MSVGRLAVLGGPPEFATPLHVGKPNLPNVEGFQRRLQQVLSSQWLTNDGPMVRELETAAGELLGVRHCVAVANATLGLELLLRTVPEKGEVLVPSFTFVATAHAISLSGHQPVFCDIDPATHNLCLKAVEASIGPRTKAILAVHAWGRPCLVNELERLASERGLALFFDSAHALGCSYGGKMLGRFGDAEVFSLHATKFVHSFEGGLITTNDDTLASNLRLARNFGFAGLDNVVALGTNAKLSEVHAAMGCSNLEAFETLRRHNYLNMATYLGELADIDGLLVHDTRFGGAGNAQYVVVETVGRGLDRDFFIDALHRENVLARRYFFPGVHRAQPYADTDVGVLAETDRVSGRVFVLPSGLAVSPAYATRVARLVAEMARLAPSAGACR